MESIEFEWDKNKNRINKKKHGISFNEAKTVFYDPEARVIDDPDHSEEEERFIILGLSLLFVSYQPGKQLQEKLCNITCSKEVSA